MARQAYARRYAQAAFQIALERNELDRWQSDLGKVVSVMADADLVAFLESPRFHFEEKVRLLSTQLAGINPLVLNLVCLLITKGRLDIISDVADEYQRLLDSYRGIERGEVITAIPLDEADRQRLADLLGSLVGKKVVVKAEVDAGLLGGVVARVGGKLLDGSTRSKLLALKKELAGAQR